MILQNRRRSEKGNILFLILLAVVLFAALSYAVTQSLRGGGQNASNEKNLVKSATITQYPVGVRAAILRMIVGGTDVVTLNFDPPSLFSDSDWNDTASAGTAATIKSLSSNVFHPNGGGAVFALIPSDALATPSSTARWFFNMEFEVPSIGTSVTTSLNGNDLIAYAPGLDQNLCTKINSELGVSSVPTIQTTRTVAVQQTVLNDAGTVTAYTANTTGTNHITDNDSSPTSGVTNNKPYLCVLNGTSYTYYHVLVER